MNLSQPIRVQLQIDDTSLRLAIDDDRPEVIEAFARLPLGERDALARDAWSIGWRAVVSARAQAAEARLSDVGREMSVLVEQKLRTQLEQQETLMLTHIRRFFDPKDGEVTERLRQFCEDQGPLARLLEKYLAPDHSVLATTLTRQLGEGSPLLRELDPDASEGVLQKIRTGLTEVLESSRRDVARAMDPLTDGGPVARFLANLREELARAQSDQKAQLAVTTAALDANNEHSLLSRLVRESESARRAMLLAMNPDAPDSPLGLLKSALVTALKEQADTQAKALRTYAEERAKMDAEIRETLVRLDERRQEERASVRGGSRFEDAVQTFVRQALRGGPYVIEATGNVVGLRAHRKVGDLVVRFTEESAFFGAAIVVEAKRDAAYGIKRALDEIELARGNRGAAVGLFVMAKSHAPSDFPLFARYGSDVLVVWDDERGETDPYLQAALFCALALASRRRRHEDDGDLEALQKVEQRLGSELERLTRMRKSTDAIQRGAEEIHREIQTAEKKLASLVGDARRTLRALHVELHEESLERSSPILLPGLTAPSRAANE